MTKKIYGILAVLLLTGACVLAALYGKDSKSSEEEAIEQSIFAKDKTLILWYVDDNLTDYLTKMSIEYQEETGIRVTPVLKSGISFFEEMNQTIKEDGDNAPDLFITSNDSIEKAYLSGLCAQIPDKTGIVNAENYPDAALHAVTCDGMLMGYPLYFETTIFLCNDSYIEDYAVKKLVQEKGADNILTVSANDFDPAELQATEEAALPHDLDGILAFADGYEAPEELESVFKWDVSDIFYNYFIIGNTIDVGGVNGDDPNVIYLYNSQSMGALLYYQSLNRFFSIEPASVHYADVINDFIDGKIVFTVATTDAVEKLEKAKQNGTFKYEYSALPMPMVSQTLDSKPLSVTDAMFINGFSEKRGKADEFATYVVNRQDKDFYVTTGKLAAKNGIVYDNDALNIAVNEYADSQPIPKLMVGSGFWAELEIAFTRVWKGEDVNDVLASLEEEVRRRFLNESVSVNRIPTPVLESEAEGEN